MSDCRHALAGKVCRFVVLVGVLALGAGPSGCSSPSKAIEDEAKAAGKTKKDFPPETSTTFPRWIFRRRRAPALVSYSESDPLEIKGRNTWMLWTGGNEAFWDWLANHSYGFIDLLKLVDFSPQHAWPRFEEAGLIVEPDTRCR